MAGQRKQSDKFTFITMPQNLHPTLKCVYSPWNAIAGPSHSFRCGAVIRQAFDEVLLDYFEKKLFPTHLFEKGGWDAVLATVNEELRQHFVKAWEEEEKLSPYDRWNQFFEYINKAFVQSILARSCGLL